MAESVTVARPYAKAAFSFAQEHNSFSQWSAMLGFASAVVVDDALSVLLDDPQLTAEKQAELFIRVCGDKLDEAGKNFVHHLTQNKRLSVLPDVAVLFEKLLAEYQRRQDVKVTSAFELSAEEQDKLKQALAKKLGKEVNLQSDVDKSLIGGVVIRAGDLVIDSSVRGQLQQLAQTLR
jgi:F-type H+-transporting ATPase subunit delta